MCQDSKINIFFNNIKITKIVEMWPTCKFTVVNKYFLIIINACGYTVNFFLNPCKKSL